MARIRALPTASRLGQPPSEETLEYLQLNIARRGFQTTLVPFKNGSDVPEYAYTTGLTAACGHPELLIAGFVPRGDGSAHDVLDTAAKWILDGKAATDLQYAWPAGRVGFRPVDADRCVLRFPVSEEFYEGTVPVHQVLWADRAGRLPGEPGCDPHAEHSQDPRGNAAAYLAASQRSLAVPGGERAPYTVFFEFPGSTAEDAVRSLRLAGHLAAAEPIKGAKRRGWWTVQAAAPRDPSADPHAWYKPWDRFAVKFGGEVTGGESGYLFAGRSPEPDL